MNENIEWRMQRKIQLEQRSDGKDSPGTITGYAAVYYDGTPETEFELYKGCVERMSKGAFSETIDTREYNVKCTFNHSEMALLGSMEGGSLRLTHDRIGVRYECDLPDTVYGRDVATLAKRGDLNGASIIFRPKPNGRRVEKIGGGEEDSRTIIWIESASLIELGPVAFPAYAGTSAAARSRSGDDHADIMERVASALRTDADRVAIAAAKLMLKDVALDSI